MRKEGNTNFELTKTKQNILKIRKRMNRREIENEKFDNFSKEKIITYLFIFLFTPYGLYRLYDRKNGFLKQQKIIWTLVSLIYVVCLIENFLR